MAKNNEIIATEKERVYAPSNGSLAYISDYAYRTAQLAPAGKPRQQSAQNAEKRRKAARKAKTFSLREFLRQNRFLPKLFAVGCAIAVAAVAFFTVTRFAGIAAVQANINELNERIESTSDSIKGLSYTTKPVVNAAEFAQEVGLVQVQP
ncbi:MAG: hypothetical protein IKI64_06080 [Clostridia bacterium]|nr:hypothetical protein [Clostridia bacterium]